MPITSKKQTPLHLGEERSMPGYVTQLCAVTEQDPLTLADRLGFARHLMVDGYALLLLLSPVSRQDFIWRDTTRFSAGWVKERVYFKEKNRLRWSDEYVQRADQDRFHFYQSDRYQSEDSWDSFLAEQERMLNVRKGGKRIVKVIPSVTGVEGDYPNAKKENALQWQLKVKKQFKCVALIGRGKIIRRGEFDSSYVV